MRYANRSAAAIAVAMAAFLMGSDGAGAGEPRRAAPAAISDTNGITSMSGVVANPRDPRNGTQPRSARQALLQARQAGRRGKNDIANMNGIIQMNGITAMNGIVAMSGRPVPHSHRENSDEFSCMCHHGYGTCRVRGPGCEQVPVEHGGCTGWCAPNDADIPDPVPEYPMSRGAARR